MIRVSVLYPSKEGARFDHDYYAKKHMAMVKSRLANLGLVRLEIDKGLAGGAPGAPAPYVCIGHLYFNSIADFQKAIGAHGAEFMADVPNYTDIRPQIQVSEIVG
ncbi:MAG: EthD family reductase [Candidatus Rokubacteria bacterium]|nr:EthD family reductase [Candidatus Rokubacteria bacterium]